MATDVSERILAEARARGVGNSMCGHDPNGQPEGVFRDANKLVLSAPTAVLMKDIIDTINKRLLGFHWAIQPDELGKVFNLFCLDFSARYGFVIRYADVQDDPARAIAVRAGMEILRRFGYAGRRFDPDLMAQVIRRPDGEAVPDLSDAKTRVARRNALDRAHYSGKLHTAVIGGHVLVGAAK